MNKNIKAGLITVGVVAIACWASYYIWYFIAASLFIAAIVLLFITIKSTLK
jgi:hypothetical protein